MSFESNNNFWLVFAIIFVAVFVVGLIIVLLLNKNKTSKVIQDKTILSVESENDSNSFQDEQIFQKVFDCISEVLPNGWKKVAVYCAVLEGMIDLNYFVDTGSGYIGCFDKSIYDRDKFDNLSFDIYGIVKETREKLSKNKKWNVMTMFVTRDGKFKSNFIYDDISKTFIEYRERWIKENIENK